MLFAEKGVYHVELLPEWMLFMPRIVDFPLGAMRVLYQNNYRMIRYHRMTREERLHNIKRFAKVLLSQKIIDFQGRAGIF